MSDIFVQTSKLKLEIENKIDDLHNSNEFNITFVKEADFMKEYFLKLKSLEVLHGKINEDINELNAMIKSLATNAESLKNQRFIKVLIFKKK
jgi:hypothetical protein